MNFVAFKKRLRVVSAKLGFYRPLRNFVRFLRGSKQDHQEVTSFYQKFVGAGKLVFDVGANRGQSSEHYIALGADVVAFEPQEELHDQIRQLCGKSDRLVIEGCALGDEVGEETLYLTEYDQVASMRPDWEGVRCGTKVIPVSTLDAMIVKHGKPDYCKIDAEGWELQVLSGLSSPIPLISFEYHSRDNELAKAGEVMERIASIGDYFANPRPNGGDGFQFADPVPISKLLDTLNTDDWSSAGQGYGDLFCSLDPTLLK